MKDKLKIKLTLDEGQVLLRTTALFNLPQKLGKNDFTELQSIAEEEVRTLYRTLKSYSPAVSKTEDRQVLFGPLDNWVKSQNPDGVVTHDAVNRHLEVEVSLSSDAVSGIVWCLLVNMHPQSRMVRGAGWKDEVGWPIAEKVKKVSALRKLLGLDTVHARKQFEDDPEIESEDSESEIKESSS